jgi:AcrR family transcriptional regulator
VNRATFYDHFPDRFGLLEDIIAENFRTVLELRMAGSPCQKHQRHFAPVAESKIKSLLRNFLLEGLRTTSPEAPTVDLELRATMASWAICGAALEWSHAKTASLEAFADSVLSLVSTTLQLRPHAT